MQVPVSGQGPRPYSPGCPVERDGRSTIDTPEEEPSMMKWTIRLRWKGQTIEIEIEIGLNL